MKVRTWLVEVYEGRTAAVRSRFSNRTRATRLRSLNWKAQPGPDGKPICLDAELVIAGGAAIRALDYVSVFLNGAAEPVYTGRVSAAPPLETPDGVYTWRVQGHFGLAKRLFPSLEYEVSGALRTHLETFLVGLLGADGVRHVPQDIGTVLNWKYSGSLVKLDTWLRDADNLTGGRLVYGWGPDRKFVVGFRPALPVRALGKAASWEERNARIANTLYARTGGQFMPILAVVDQPSVDADGPLEDEIDLTGLVTFRTAGVGPQPSGFWVPGESVRVDWDFPGVSYQSPHGSQSGNFSLEFTLRGTHAGGVDDIEVFTFSGTRTGPDENNLDTTTYAPQSGTFTRYVEHAYTNITLTQTFPIFPQLSGPSAQFTGEDYSAVRARCLELLAEKYGPELRGTWRIENHYEPVGGSVRARYRDGGQDQEVVLQDQESRYTLDETGFTTEITAGSRTRYTVAQQLRNRIEAVAKQVSGGTL